MRNFSDEEIKTVIVDHLSWDTGVDASQILVSVDNGNVTLTGTAGSYSEKQEALRAARHVSGVRAVKNDIMVIDSSNKKSLPDKEIEDAVKNAFLWNPHIDEAGINVQVIKGIVTLTGCVRHYSQCIKAENIVSEISGVKGIVDELGTVCREKIEDELIKKSIVDRIHNSEPSAVENLRINVSNGFVDISGSVHSYHAENRIFEIISRTNGVTGIKNNLETVLSTHI